MESSTVERARTRVTPQRRRLAWSLRIGALGILLLPLANCSGGADHGPVTAAREQSPAGETIVEVTATGAHTADATVLAAPSASNATVTVPDATLGTVDPATLTARVVSLDRPADAGHGITFVLGPDGAHFAAPVLLEWDGLWTADLKFALRARHGDGTPIVDEGTPAANSVAALRGDADLADHRALHALPVDHFSMWSVVAHTQNGRDAVGVLAKLPDELVVGTSVEVGVLTASGTRDRLCSGLLVHGDAVVSATAPTELQCNREPATNISFVVRCLAPGTGRIEAKVLAITADGSTSSPARDDTAVPTGFQVQLLDSLYRMEALARPNVVADSFVRSEHGLDGTAFGFTFGADVRCVAPVATTTSTTSTTLAPRPTTRPAPDAGATGPTGATGPVGATGATGPSPTTAPPTTMPATAMPPTTVPSDPVIPTTTVPPDTPWGPAGTWAYNEYGSCDWNGTGGCGWYYGTEHGTYVLGEIGGPGATWPVG